MANVDKVVTVDGTSGVGKGTMSRMLAQHLGWHYLDSGALYRLTALRAAQQGVDYQDEEALATIARKLNVEFRVTQAGEEPAVILAGEIVNAQLREETISRAASIVSAHPRVREALLQRQRDFYQPPGLVTDGRDMGTLVFPRAVLKFFLVADARVRAERRFQQLQEAGLDGNIAAILQDIEARDARDQNRTVAPLKPAEDAIVIDTSSLAVEQVYDIMIANIEKKIAPNA